MATSYSVLSARLASQDMARLAAFSVLVSSGTVLAAIGMGQVGVTGGALYYLVSSTLGIAALFLLIELVERPRARRRRARRHPRGYGEDDEVERRRKSASRFPRPWVCSAWPFSRCALVIAGLPPLSGFIAKFALLTAALNPRRRGAVPSRPLPGLCLSC